MSSIARKTLKKLIEELKIYENSDTLSLVDFLYILSRLTLKDCFPSLKMVQQFVQKNHLNDKDEWKQIQDEVLEKMFFTQIEHLSSNILRTKTEPEIDTKKQESQLELEGKGQPIIVSFTNLIRDQNKSMNSNPKFCVNKAKLTKIKPNKTLERIISAVKSKSQKDKQNQNPFFSERSEQGKTEQQNAQNLLRNSFQEQQMFKIRQNQLNFIVADLQFKKDYFQTFYQNSQVQEIHELNKKIQALRKKLNRRLKQLFLHYSNENYDSSQSFEVNNNKLKQIDLRLFLKYFRQIKEANIGAQLFVDENTFHKFKPGNLMNSFKIYGDNKKDINMEQFLNINYYFLLDIKTNPKIDQQEELLLESFRIQKDQQEDLKSLQKQAEKFQKGIQIFYNKKINKILNVKEKQDFCIKLRQKQDNKKSSLSQNFQTNRFEKYIDQSLEDYETTRIQIHESFLKSQPKQKVNSLNQRLNRKKGNKESHSQSQQNNKKTKKNNEIPLKKIKGKLLTETHRKGIAQEYTNSQSNCSISVTKRNLFEQIISQARQQQQDDQNTNIFNQKRSISLGNLGNRGLKERRRQIKKDFLSQRILHSPQELKSIFSLPKITRLSQQSFQRQSIVKTLDYLHQVIGKNEVPKIKKILQIDNPQKRKANAIQNQYLKEYFKQESIQWTQKQAETTKIKINSSDILLLNSKLKMKKSS